MEIIIFLVLFVIAFPFAMILIVKVGENLGYSKYAYSIPAATANNVIYPSLDPSIFELRYPNTDIKGKVVPL